MFDPKSKLASQLDSDSGLSRAGGSQSKASTPVLQDTAGSKLAKMQSMLLGQKSGADTEGVKKLGLASGKQRQFGTLASTGKTPAPKKGKIFRVPK